MDGFNEKKWFVYLTDHHEGPFSLSEIQAKIDQSQVTTANYIWAEGMTDWKPMNDVREFESLLGTRQAIAPAAMESAAPVLSSTPIVESVESPVAVEVAVEEKTGDLDPADLKRATEPATAPARTGLQDFKIQDRRKAERVEAPVKRSYARPIKWAIFTLVPAGIAGAYFNGSLDPVLNSPAVKAGSQAMSDMAQPYLLKLADKVPALTRWVSPIPSLEDVAPEDYELLKAAALQKPESGAKIAVAASTADAFSPTFYVSSNLRDGAVVDVYVEGISDTLMNQLAFSGKVQATITKKLGKTGPVRYPDGKSVPRGEYVIYATEAEQQPDAVKAVLANIPPVAAKLAPVLPRGLKLLVSKSAFLGGSKDAIYASRLKEFHDRLRGKSVAEIAELKQLEGLLENQLMLTTNKYNQLRGLVRNGKPSSAARKSWTDFNAQWSKIDGQLKESYGKWTDQALQTDYFYGTLYSLTKTAGEAVDKLHQLHVDFFDGKKDFKTLEIERGSAVSIASDAVTALKNKVTQAENLAPTPNGMPRREGL